MAKIMALSEHDASAPPTRFASERETAHGTANPESRFVVCDSATANVVTWELPPPAPAANSAPPAPEADAGPPRFAHAISQTVSTWAPERIDPAVVFVNQPSSAVCEHYRGIAARLVSANQAQRAPLIAITSSVRGEGRSVTSANLAFALAESGRHRVALVDADLRGRSLARLLNLRESPGLVELAEGAVEFELVLQDSPFPLFKVVTAGAAQTRPHAELLGAGGMGAALQRLRETFDYVIIDTPAVTQVADACLLAPQCDGALLLVEAGRTAESVVTQAVRALRGAGVRIMACVMTRVADASARNDDRYRRNHQL